MLKYRVESIFYTLVFQFTSVSEMKTDCKVLKIF